MELLILEAKPAVRPLLFSKKAFHVATRLVDLPGSMFENEP